jgi:hypothetical protein
MDSAPPKPKLPLLTPPPTAHPQVVSRPPVSRLGSERRTPPAFALAETLTVDLGRMDTLDVTPDDTVPDELGLTDPPLAAKPSPPDPVAWTSEVGDLAVCIQVESPRAHRALIRQLMADGIVLLHPAPPAPGTLLRCILADAHDREVDLPVRVTRTGETMAGPVAHLALDTLTPSQRRQLSRLLAQLRD